MIKLSKRMQAIADLVTPGLSVADIGCDHGYLPIYLVQNQIINRAVAMDIKKGPISAAQDHIHREGLDDYITTRLSDGLQNLQPTEGQSVIIAGMGGRLILKILADGKRFYESGQIQELILQPQSELSLFRRSMRQMGFVCQKEDMVLEDGKYYPMGRYVYQETHPKTEDEITSDQLMQDVEDEYGAFLLHHQHIVLKQYLSREERQLEHIKQSLDKIKDEEKRDFRYREVEIKLQKNKLARSFYA